MKTKEITKYYYIHGLGSSKNSSKFLELQKQYDNIECLEWNENNNINLLFEKWLIKINDSLLQFDNICIVASSTGANFAYQIRNFFKSTSKQFIHLVLINPLFDMNYLFNLDIIPSKLSKFIGYIHKISETLILIGAKDDVINHNKFLLDYQFIKNNNQIIIDNNSTHKFENLNLYYNKIDDYINSLAI